MKSLLLLILLFGVGQVGCKATTSAAPQDGTTKADAPRQSNSTSRTRLFQVGACKFQISDLDNGTFTTDYAKEAYGTFLKKNSAEGSPLTVTVGCTDPTEDTEEQPAIKANGHWKLNEHYPPSVEYDVQLFELPDGYYIVYSPKTVSNKGSVSFCLASANQLCGGAEINDATKRDLLLHDTIEFIKSIKLL